MLKLNIQSAISKIIQNVSRNELVIKRSLVTTFNVTSKLNDINQKNSVSFEQIAFYRRNNFTRPFNWVKRRGGGYDENLTTDNKKFLDDVVIDKYSNSPLKEGPWKRGEFDANSVNKRLGLIGVKLGSLPQWTKEGKKIYTTLIQVLDNHVIDYIPPE
ncbi:unnamed protein product, partial [Brachionus calyciflorus]